MEQQLFVTARNREKAVDGAYIYGGFHLVSNCAMLRHRETTSVNADVADIDAERHWYATVSIAGIGLGFVCCLCHQHRAATKVKERIATALEEMN